MNRSGIMVVLLLVACVILFPYTWGGLVWDDHILLTEGLWKEGSVSSIWMQSIVRIFFHTGVDKRKRIRYTVSIVS